MEYTRNLELAKALFNKEELSDEEITEWNQINRMEDLTEKLIAHMNKDTTLTKTILEYLLKSGSNWEQAILVSVGMADYFLSKCRPDECGYDAFHDFWIDGSVFDVETYEIVDQAVNRAFEELISAEVKKGHDKFVED